MARRFVTYNTEDQAAGLVNVDERGVLQPVETLALISPNGTVYTVTVSDDGTLTATAAE